ncbi:hypothetical protein [uncultured Ruminococcus sp.]|uniref:hypothetical protein n=1 Tax=uncultured Ruminococcus sp. TaxID=165186 RepID=UPI0026134C8C|nr:hypothetical protein [uncultured Ruminococcus sp.]
MSKGNGFFSNLRRSTRITLVSCGCFIALTALILFFFVMFPITPSEKMITSFGRESISKQDTTTAPVTTAVTTMNDDIIIAKGTRTTTASKTTAKKYTTHRLTSGAGFYMDQRIPTGQYPNEYYVPTTTTAAEGGYSGGTGLGGLGGGEGQTGLGGGEGQTGLGGGEGQTGLGGGEGQTGLGGGEGTETPGGGTETPAGGGTETPAGGGAPLEYTAEGN